MNAPTFTDAYGREWPVDAGYSTMQRLIKTGIDFAAVTEQIKRDRAANELSDAGRRGLHRYHWAYVEPQAIERGVSFEDFCEAMPSPEYFLEASEAIGRAIAQAQSEPRSFLELLDVVAEAPSSMDA